MKIFVSKAYQKWLKTSRDPMARDAVEGFLGRVFYAADITNIPQRPKAVGKDMSNPPAVVDEFSLGRRSRAYSKCLRSETGEYEFYLASAGSKSVKRQCEDIITALNIFNNFAAEEWIVWEPTSEFSMPESGVENVALGDVDTGDATVEDVASDVVPVTKTKKKKKSSVDESGLTPAERKKRLQQLNEEKRRQEQAAAKERRLAKLQAAQSAVAQNVVPEVPVTDRADDVPAVVAENIASAPVSDEKVDVSPATVKVAQDANVLASVPASNNDVIAEPVAADDKPEYANAPTVMLNGAPVAAPQPPTGDIEFQDVANIHHELESIEYQMKIKQLNVEIAEQKIVIAQNKIELAKLEMRKLELLRAQKMQNMHE